MKGAWVALALAIASSSAHAGDCKLTQIATLPTVFDRSGGPTVPVTLGSKQAWMLVDTGGTFSMLGKHVVDETHASTSQIKGGRFSLVSNKALKEIAEVRPFALGEMKTEKFNFLVLPDGEVGSSDLGTIAPDILANFDVEFDLGHRKMNPFSQNHCAGKVVYWANDWAEIPFSSPDNLHILVDMTLHGKAMKAELDTGSSSSFLNESVAEDMFGIGGDAPQAQGGIFGHTFKSLNMNDVAMNNPEFLILPDKSSSMIGHFGKMLLGMKQLGQQRLYIACKDQVIYVTSASATKS